MTDVEIQDKILTGPPKGAEELVEMLERRMGSMKMVGERDDLLLDAAIFIKNILLVTQGQIR